MTTTCTAPGCYRPADGYLCQRDQARARDTLAELPELLVDLEITTSRMAQTSHRGRGHSKRPDAGLPFDWNASDTEWAIRNTVTTWARHVSDERGGQPPPHFAALCGWLAQQVSWMAGRPEAAVFLDEITSLRPAAAREVDNREDRYAGPCTATVVQIDLHLPEHQPYGPICMVCLHESCSAIRVGQNELRPVPVERVCAADLRTRHGAAVIRCRACGAEYDAAERAGWIDQRAAEHVAAAAQIAQALTDSGYPTKAATIRKWGQRGRERMLAAQRAAGAGPACICCQHRSCETLRRGREFRTDLELDLIAPCAYSVADRLALYRVGPVYARVKAEKPLESERIGA